MTDLSSLSSKELQRYHRSIAHCANVRSHRDMLDWLQGDFQRYLPHDIMLAAWGDFESDPCTLRHDIISSDANIRTKNLKSGELAPLLRTLFIQWRQVGNSPFACQANDSDWFVNGTLWSNALGQAACTTQSMLVHGISDKRSGHDCLYIALRLRESFNSADQIAMATLTPVIDAALRQVDLLPVSPPSVIIPPGTTSAQKILSVREREILHWVTVGKTNPEIGCILGISEFTVKNHMKRIFRKINVSNRAQAVGKLQAINTPV